MNLLFFAYYLFWTLVIIALSANISVLTENSWIGILTAILFFTVIHLMRIALCASFLFKEIGVLLKNDMSLLKKSKISYPELSGYNINYQLKIKFTDGILFISRRPIGMNIKIEFFSEKYINYDFFVTHKMLADKKINIDTSNFYYIENETIDFDKIKFFSELCVVKLEKVFNSQVKQLLLLPNIKNSYFHLSKKGEKLCIDIHARSAYIARAEEFFPHFILLKEINNNLLFYKV